MHLVGSVYGEIQWRIVAPKTVACKGQPRGSCQPSIFRAPAGLPSRATRGPSLSVILSLPGGPLPGSPLTPCYPQRRSEARRAPVPNPFTRRDTTEEGWMELIVILFALAVGAGLLYVCFLAVVSAGLLVWVLWPAVLGTVLGIALWRSGHDNLGVLFIRWCPA